MGCDLIPLIVESDCTRNQTVHSLSRVYVHKMKAIEVPDRLGMWSVPEG